MADPRSRCQTVGEHTYTILREGIVTGVFAPGERLRQDAPAADIGVSRVPVRSALLRLESEGLVSFHPHGGAIVRALTAAQVREIFNLRLLLESYALGKSAARMSSERAARLMSLAHKVDHSEAGPELLEARLDYYRELYDADNHPVLMDLIEWLRGSLGSHLLEFRLDHPSSAHQRVASRVCQGDVEAAQGLLREHLNQVCTDLVGKLNDAYQQAPEGA